MDHIMITAHFLDLTAKEFSSALLCKVT